MKARRTSRRKMPPSGLEKLTLPSEQTANCMCDPTTGLAVSSLLLILACYMLDEVEYMVPILLISSAVFFLQLYSKRTAFARPGRWSTRLSLDADVFGPWGLSTFLHLLLQRLQLHTPCKAVETRSPKAPTPKFSSPKPPKKSKKKTKSKSKTVNHATRMHRCKSSPMPNVRMVAPGVVSVLGEVYTPPPRKTVESTADEPTKRRNTDPLPGKSTPNVAPVVPASLAKAPVEKKPTSMLPQVAKLKPTRPISTVSTTKPLQLIPESQPRLVFSPPAKSNVLPKAKSLATHKIECKPAPAFETMQDKWERCLAHSSPLCDSLLEEEVEVATPPPVKPPVRFPSYVPMPMPVLTELVTSAQVDATPMAPTICETSPLYTMLSEVDAMMAEASALIAGKWRDLDADEGFTSTICTPCLE